MLLANGDGTFQSAVKYSSGKGASSVVIGDFDSDGNNDIAVPDEPARPSQSIWARVTARCGTPFPTAPEAIPLVLPWPT